MKRKLFELLNELGVPCNIKGREYIESAIEIAMQRGIISITKELYPAIARKYSDVPHCVERAIRHGVEICFYRGNLDFIKEVFGSTISYEKGKLTNSEFIYGIAKYLKTHEEEEK